LCCSANNRIGHGQPMTQAHVSREMQSNPSTESLSRIEPSGTQ
jgi:hypothetical protein